MMSRRNFRTITEASEVIFDEIEDYDNIDLIIIPPDPDELTDQEDFNDEECGPSIGDNIVTETAGTYEILIDDETNTDFDTYTVRERDWSSIAPTYTHSPIDIEQNIIAHLKEDYHSLTPFEIFLRFFDERVIQLIVSETNRYAQQKNESFRVDQNDIYAFIGILSLSGYHTLPQYNMYWCLDDDIHIPFVRETMSRNKFRSIKQFIHFGNNNNLDHTDKFTKLRPILDLLNENFMQFGIFSHFLSIDEMMIPYTGKHSCKMFMQNKPVRFGFKAWCQASNEGYVFNFDLYQGKATGNQGSLGVGGNVVTNLLSVIPVNERRHHVVCFDNFFSSLKLFDELNKQGYFAIGTVRENRAKSIIPSVASMKKMERGSIVYAFDQNNEILLTKWKDNKFVSVISNTDSVEPVVPTRRFSRAAKKYVTFPQPHVINTYNANMGGVDLADQFVSTYRSSIRGKKWYWTIFMQFFDVSVSNAWLLYRKFHPEERIQLLAVKRSITTSLMKLGKNPNASVTGPPSTFKKSLNIVPTGHHNLEKKPKRTRCVLCHSQTFFYCPTCKVTLHVGCSPAYHTQN